jgi:glucokinase
MSSGLIADIGATNARFALVEDGEPRHQRILLVEEHATLEAAVAA